MKIEQTKEELQLEKYDFLKEDKNLGSNIIILTLGGSYAYGTNNENRDLDIRGCALNSKTQILTNENFEQFVKVDCAKIAMKYGGGGHKGASRFSTERLLFET